MARDIFDVSAEAWEGKTVAVKEFTDREDPQEAFERKVRILHKDWGKTYYVLCYYGIGGIGKTSFINKLCRLTKGSEDDQLRLLDKIDCDYIHYDFDAKNSGTDKLSILLCLRRQLGAINKKFKFYRFDSAILLYAKRTGGDLEMDETVQSLLESNPWVKNFISVASIIPSAGIFASGTVLPTLTSLASGFEFFDKSTAMIRGTVKKHIKNSKYSDHLRKIDRLEPPELLSEMHKYFIDDMRHNMKKVAKRPLIIFLDTYEKYIDTLNQDVNMITEDYWLRKGLWEPERKSGPESEPETKSGSVIRSIPGILWVVTGREKLYWGEDDLWDELKAERPLSDMNEAEKEELAKTHLEQHLLGDLSLKDATDFLKKAGITSDTLCKQLYDLTSGTPLFLDICVDSYHQISQGGLLPTISNFGKDLNQLIALYLSGMSDVNREMSYFLACLGKWDDESVIKIAAAAKTLRWYTNSRYEDFVNHSFIIRNEDGSYKMHETFRMAAEKNADKEIWEEICLLKLQNARENVEKNIVTDLARTLTEYVEILLYNEYTYDMYYENIVEISEHFGRLDEAGGYDLFYRLAKELYEKISTLYPKTGLDYISRREYSKALLLKSLVKEALKIVEPIPLDGNYDITERGKAIINLSIASVYLENGIYSKAIEISKKIMNEWINTLGENHPDTLVVMNNLAISYGLSGEIQKSLEMFEEIYKLDKERLGENHPDTLSAMSNLANSYSNIGDIHNALKMREQVYDLRKEILGLNHPDTLSSMLSLATSYGENGEMQKEHAMLEEVYKLSKELLGETHPLTLTSMHNLAPSYSDIGEIQKAYSMNKQIFELQTELLGEKHPDTLKSMHNLANSYSDLGETKKSHEMLEEVYKLEKEILGEKHPGTLNTMGNLASSFGDLGETEKAHEMFEEVYKLKKEILGEKHPDTLEAMYSLAVSYNDNKEKQKAYEMSEGVYKLRKEILGEKHPDTLTALYNLAYLYNSNGEKQTAIELQEQVYTLRKEVLGEKHADTIDALRNLASFYENNDENQKALEMKEQLYELKQEILGEKHPKTIDAMNALALLYEENGEVQKALALSEGVYELSKEVYGEKHPKTIDAMTNLAIFLAYNEENQQALEMQEQVYKLAKEILGDKHPETIDAMILLAKLYRGNEEKQKALALSEEVYELSKEVYGEKRPETIDTMILLTKLYKDNEEKQKALALSEEVYELSKEIYGEKHPKTIGAITNLAAIWAYNEENQQALEMQEQVYGLSKEVYGEKHPDTIDAMYDLAALYEENGEMQKALALSEEVYEFSKEVYGEKHPDTLDVMTNLAILYEENGELQKAEAIRILISNTRQGI